MGTELKMSLAYHSHTDGQTERINRCLETYLRGLCMQQLGKWKTYLSAAKWWYNTSFHTSMQMTPFQALYGYKPSQLCLDLDQTRVTAVEDWMRDKVN